MDKVSVNQNFKVAVEYLISNKIAKNKTEIALKLGLSKSGLSEILNNRMNVNIDTVGLIQKVYRVNENFLLNGKGGILGPEFFIEEKNIKTHEIPLLPLEAFAGNGDENTNGVSHMDLQDKYIVPLFDGLKTDFMISVKGSSMYPKYSSGDVVACRMIEELLFIQWNKVYVIDTISQGVIMKRLKKADSEESIICKSDNKEYDEFSLPKKDIRKIALVVGVIRLE